MFKLIDKNTFAQEETLALVVTALRLILKLTGLQDKLIRMKVAKNKILNHKVKKNQTPSTKTR